MKFLIVANFKSNKTSSQVREWVEVVAPRLKNHSQDILVGVAPSLVHLPIVSELLTSRFADTLNIVSQDVSPFPEGSYTGAVAASQLRDLGVSYSIIGHSERRRYFHETPAEIANKAAELLRVGITPILCLAEEDIFPQLAALTDDVKDKVIYCYEPPGSIGGTEIPATQDIKRVIERVRSSLDSPARVMYGGSVNSETITTLCRDVVVDGVLVASASLEPTSFVSIISQVDTL